MKVQSYFGYHSYGSHNCHQIQDKIDNTALTGTTANIEINFPGQKEMDFMMLIMKLSISYNKLLFLYQKT